MYVTLLPLDSFMLTVMQTNYILLYLSLLYIPSNAYRRKTSKILQLTKPVRTTKKSKKKPKSEESEFENDNDDEDADDGKMLDRSPAIDEDADDGKMLDRSPAIDEMESRNKEDDTGWFDDLKADRRFADEDEDMFPATGTPLDLRTWVPSTEPTTETTTERMSTPLMDLKVIGFNNTWCDYVNKADTVKIEGKDFVDAVQKFCSKNLSEDNDARLALRHTLENRKLIDRLMNDIVARLAGNDTEVKEKILNPKYKVSSINEFCYNRSLKSFKYLCFDPDMNPYMRRYLNIVSNACRIPGFDEEKIRDHLAEACEKINNNLIEVF